MKRLHSLLIPVFLIASLGAAPKSDQYSVDDLEKLQAEKQKTEEKLKALEGAVKTAEEDISQLNRRLLLAAQESRRREEEAANIERRLIDLNIRKTEVTDRVLADEESFEDLIAALAVASSKRPPALVVNPDHAGNAIRSAILMSTTAPALKERATKLELELQRLRNLTRKIEFTAGDQSDNRCQKERSK